jgi:hypothetical protein
MSPVPKKAKKTFTNRVGGIRPSQLMHTFGVGAMVDLPNFSVIVSGLDEWKTDYSAEIAEERLLRAVRSETALGMEKVTSLRAAPWLEETKNPFEQWAWTGVPVLPFPRWMRCTACNLLTTIDGGLLELSQNPWRPDQTRYLHKSCAKTRGKPPTAVPARFVVACPESHIDEFPWLEFAHNQTGGTCPKGSPHLIAKDIGQGTRSTDMIISCSACGSDTYMNLAFGEQAAAMLPQCRGRHAHIRRFDPDGCTHQVRPLLLGASNAWFAATRSVLSIPSSSDALDQALDESWPKLNDPATPVESLGVLKVVINMVPELKRLAPFDPEAVWAAIEARRSAVADSEGETDLLLPEWKVFVESTNLANTRDFRLGPPTNPPGFAAVTVVAAERLREVIALCGFTRIDGPDSGVASDMEGPVPYAPMSRHPTDWLPAAEVRGEGIFVRIDESTLKDWVAKVAGGPQLEALRSAHQEWRRRRGHADVNFGWPGERYVLLHSLSHVLINTLALECGYSASSIRERIYAREDMGDSPAMAGFLLYTAAPDSEGTLGGLVALAEPDEFARILSTALNASRLCSSDPMCASHQPDEADPVLHSAACHGCLFLPETSCERGNRYLDRNTLIETLAGMNISYSFAA